MVDAKPWLDPNAKAGSYALGLLGLEERKLLYQLARYIYAGEGAVVDLGAFCGASTCCLAAGLRDNPRAVGRHVDAYDSFIASEPYLVDFIRAQFGEAFEMGQSFGATFRRATAEFADLIEVHDGDLLEQSWPSDEPIEILFVDVAKTLALSGKVLTEFFPRLTPGKSIVIHQDFYHPTAFYLPVVMDFLMDHFTIIEAGRDWSVVFRLETPIPQEKLQTASQYKFSFAQQQAGLRRMMRRVGMPGSEYLRLSECAAIGTHFGERRFQVALAAAIRRSRLETDRVWSDGLAWCSDFKASRIRTRLYGTPSLMPPPTSADKAHLLLSDILSEVAARIMPGVRQRLTG
ncbi:MAG: class I SAM-dependent methyltransferase [Candidatus Binatus sp.]|uniref:class I SAM-dependent methyltransferase n=1 Tax=Candidatus Binatus sp. TaxID=2811406 RepID=UPI003BB208D1